MSAGLASALVAGLGAWCLTRLLPPMAVWAGYSAALAALVWLGAAGLGWRLLPPERGAEPEAALARLGLASAAGLGLLALVVLLLAWAGLLLPYVGAALVVLCWLAGLRGLREAARALKAEGHAACHGLVPAALLLGVMAATAAMPPHQYDSLVYHLPLPELYLAQNGLEPVPGLLYSHFMQGAEMLFLLAMWLGSDLASQFLTASATVSSALIVYGWGRRWGSPKLGAGAALLFAAHPAVLLLGATTYVEPWLGLWTAAALSAFARWYEEPGSGDGRWLALSGLFCGFACAVKYTGILTPALLGLFVLLRGGRGPFRSAALFALAAAAPVLPWLGKNLYYSGNPVYPFFYKLFPAAPGWETGGELYFTILSEYHHQGFLRELLLFPGRLLKDVVPVRFGGGMDVLGDAGWVLPLLGAALALPAFVRDRRWRFVGLYLAGHMLLWFATGVVLRFLVPLAGVFALAAAQGFGALWTRAGRAGRAAIAAGLAALGVVQLGAFAFVHAVFETPNVLLGLEGPGEYLERRLAYYPCARRTAELDPNARILVVGEQRSYYVARPSLAPSVYLPNPIHALGSAASSPRDLSARLKVEGFTHLLWVPAEAERLRNYESMRETDAPAWKGLLASAPAVFRASGCELKELP